MLKKLDDRDSEVERDSDGSWSAFSSVTAGQRVSLPRARSPVPSYKPSNPAPWQERHYKSSIFIARRAHTWEGGGNRK
ncbi:hypothetical protein ILYODFUR_032118 [Ilyodon furcidens]|uniref:Uncharacterized protein n=1 Tax=Ilyodon furcidens TaxID=33524 RepID=A0ABV0UC39_9TELE